MVYIGTNQIPETNIYRINEIKKCKSRNISTVAESTCFLFFKG